MNNFDSRVETYEHIQKVQKYLARCANYLLYRLLDHDQSKLSGMEKEAFDLATPRLEKIEYGS